MTKRIGRFLGDPQIPERVRNLILAKEIESERLIGWVQLGVVATFAGLFLIAPRPADAGMTMYEPVPIALAAYGLFTVGRLLLSYRGPVPGPVLILSILADVALLLGLIWSFHLQYGQAAAFSLKIPTVIYIFVFVALRALRFDPRYVLAAGLFAAVGWGILLAATVRASAPEAVTRNFVTYLTSNSILYGAEFDKIFTILLVSGILTVAVWRARRTLFAAVREEVAGREVRRFLSDGVAEAIAGADELIAPGAAAERQAAIVMIDIRGFTRFSMTVPPAEVVALLTGLHARILPIIQRHGGVVDKFLGDGIMATFGAVRANETAAADALRALDEAMAEATRWSEDHPRTGSRPTLAVNGAVVAGTVVFATLGSADRLEYTVIGEAVNLSAKLEKHNKVAGTRALTDRPTLERALAQGYQPGSRLKSLPASDVAGVAEALDLIVVA
ncbi:MAG: adenylate/guanylate cyclase domain-containing protein [Hyphomicrobiaceae bacterium]